MWLGQKSGGGGGEDILTNVVNILGNNTKEPKHNLSKNEGKSP